LKEFKAFRKQIKTGVDRELTIDRNDYSRVTIITWYYFVSLIFIADDNQLRLASGKDIFIVGS
jgi:hypothetical protein